MKETDRIPQKKRIMKLEIKQEIKLESVVINIGRARMMKFNRRGWTRERSSWIVRYL